MRNSKLNILLITFLLALMVFQIGLQPAIAAEAEQPSKWAVEDVQMAGVYGLADESMFTEYTTAITREELYTVAVSVYEKLSGGEYVPVEVTPYDDTDSEAIVKAYELKLISSPVTGSFEPTKSATRYDVVDMIYNLIKTARPEFNYSIDVELKFKDSDGIPESSMDAVKYAVAKGLIKGRADNNKLDLSTGCSRQELLIFARRAYEFIIYESGQASKGPFWKVSGGKSDVYLLGSIHIADSRIYPMSRSILEAFGKSDYLVVEADISNMQDSVLYIQQKMFYRDDNTLDKNISPETYELFVKKMEEYGIAPMLYNKFKPWYAAMLIQNLELAGNSYDANLGVDLYFMNKVTQKKELIEIEGVKFQIDLFDSFSAELQEQYLRGVLEPETGDTNVQVEVMEAMLTAWKEGDIETLEAIISSSDGSDAAKEFNEKVIIERNNNMTQKVLTYLSDDKEKTYFVIVGAGHMVGDTGIVKQLGNEGYTVEQVLD